MLTTVEQLHELCLSFPGASLDHPFGPQTDVFKVGGKLFALTIGDAEPLRVNLKCEPMIAAQLREEFPDSVLPGYHMNKRHWNTVILDGSLDDRLVTEQVEDSYDLVVESLPRAKRPS